MDRAVDLFSRWATAQEIPGLELHVARAEGRTPLLLMEIPGEGRGTVLLYGHLDKQPPMEGWRPDLGPWTPVLEDGKLYGRGGADDGYGMFAALTAIKALKLESIPCARCVVLIEGCEESGSFDLPHYVDALADRIGTPDLVVCLDSGCGDYERMWVTTSLRGVINATLSVSTLTEGVHSGAASGIVPSSFRILRPPVEPAGGRGHRGDPAARAARGDPARPACAGQGRGRGAGYRGAWRVSVPTRRHACKGRARRAGAEPHLASAARDHRRRGTARAGAGRQRPASGNPGQALVASSPLPPTPTPRWPV